MRAEVEALFAEGVRYVQCLVSTKAPQLEDVDEVVADAAISAWGLEGR
jgi:hypothetical protein